MSTRGNGVLEIPSYSPNLWGYSPPVWHFGMWKNERGPLCYVLDFLHDTHAVQLTLANILLMLTLDIKTSVKWYSPLKPSLVTKGLVGPICLLDAPSNVTPLSLHDSHIPLEGIHS